MELGVGRIFVSKITEGASAIRKHRTAITTTTTTTTSKAQLRRQIPIEHSAPMAVVSLKASPPNPSWFTPKRLLLIFCVINLLNYVDRGAIASNGVNGSLGTCTESGICTSGSGIQGDFNLNNFQDGVLSSAFMVGLLVASPIFASLAKSHNPFRLIGVGLSVWTFATAGCGISFNFWSITFCRMLVGVGEASFISLAAPFIDDNAPVEQKTAWLAMFYMCIPSGVALGYVYGGLVGNYLNWRYAFWGEAFCMLPFAILGFVMKPLQLKGLTSGDSDKALTVIETAGPMVEEVSNIDDHVLVASDKGSRPSSVSKLSNLFTRFSKDMKVLLVDKVYAVNVLGYVSYNFVIGAYSYWGPKAGYNIYHMNNADLLFGGITVVCGILGTLSGGFILDSMTATISNAFKLLSGATFLGAIFCFSSFCFKSLYGFIALFSVGEILVFATQAPVNYVCLHCVKPSLRPLSMAISTVSIHIFGDVPSSPLVGLIQDNINNWRVTSLILTAVLFVAAGIWFIGIFLNSVDRFNEDFENQVAANTRGSLEPLLEENRNAGPVDSGES
ncbi:probable sphingolipid transporter spinster homolog 2 isoform X1 [Ziziphus jujuba]|nr:probable sphingolipid transporter spinster homolog 2 isoform X1 [Ziziphus jujuba]